MAEARKRPKPAWESRYGIDILVVGYIFRAEVEWQSKRDNQDGEEGYRVKVNGMTLKGRHTKHEDAKHRAVSAMILFSKQAIEDLKELLR